MHLNKVRMKEHSGIVTNDTSTTQFSFVVSPLKNRAHVEKNDYIALNHPTLGETCPIIATVQEIRSYEQVAGSTLSERVGKMMATAKIIGYTDIEKKNKQIQTLVIPPDPGSRVYLFYSEFLQQIFTTDTQGKTYNPPLHIGKTAETAINQNEDTKQLNYYLDPKNVTKTHTLITAVGTSGKTYTAKIIIKELVNKTQQPIIVFDPYNEYFTTDEQNQFDYKAMNLTTPRELVKTIKPKQVTTLIPEKVNTENKNSFYAQALETLWKARLNETAPPFTLIIENAETIEPKKLEQVVYEGTKYGISLILISKQPSQLGTNILSQMTTQIIGKTADSNYLNYLKNILPQDVTKIPKLKQEEWIINTNSQQQTTQITTRNVNKKQK